MEYNLNINIAFANYQTVFDTVEHRSIINFLKNTRIDYQFTALLENIYKNAISTIQLHVNTRAIAINCSQLP